MEIYNNHSDFFNKIIEINNSNIYKSVYREENIKTNDIEYESIVRNETWVSNNYFLCLYDKNNEHVHKWYDWICKKDSEHEFEYMYGEEPKYYPYIDQFHHIELKNNSINDINEELDVFFNIVNESKGKIYFLIDIDYLLQILKINNRNNHILDFLLHRLKNIPENIILLDINNKFKQNSLLYYQFNSVLLNKQNNYITQYLTILKIIDDPDDDYYWYIAKQNHNLKLIEHIENDDNLLAGIYLLNDKNKCVVLDIELSSLVNKNLMDNMSKEEFVINPLERFYEIII